MFDAALFYYFYFGGVGCKHISTQISLAGSCILSFFRVGFKVVHSHFPPHASTNNLNNSNRACRQYVVTGDARLVRQLKHLINKLAQVVTASGQATTGDK